MEKEKLKAVVYQIQSASWKNFLPLSAAMLVSYARKIPEIADAYDFEIQILRKDIDCPKADVSAFSAYSWNFRHSLELARHFKNTNPKGLVIFGGPMIPNHKELIKSFFEDYPFIDIAVHGMGEWPFSEILLCRIGKKEISSISGISFRSKEGISTKEPEYIRNLDELGSPFLDGTFDQIMACYSDKITGALWETNRGCPYTCAYCVQGNSKFSRIMPFKKEKLGKELEWMAKNKMEYIFGTDANFGILPQDLEIVDMIAESGRKTGYPKYFIINWLKNSNKKMLQIVEKLKEGGVHTQLTMSMQSLNPATLEAIGRTNMDFLEFEELKKESAERGISTYTELILGLPEDSYETILATLGKCLDRRRNHFLVVYLLRLLDATKMAEPEYVKRYGIKTKTCPIGIPRHRWNLNSGISETEEIVVANSTLPIEDWKRAFTFVYAYLAMYNFRLCFFIFNYLKSEFSVSITALIEYIISEKDSFPAVKKAIGVINESRQAVLDGRMNLITLDFTENLLFEPHEAALLLLIKEKDPFYQELLVLVEKYLKMRNIRFQEDILKEVFKYQSSSIPSWEKREKEKIRFGYSIPEYFDSSGVVYKKESFAESQGTEEMNPVDFVKSRLTISNFKINQLKKI